MWQFGKDQKQISKSITETISQLKKRQSPAKGPPDAPDIHCETSGKISLIESSFPYIHKNEVTVINQDKSTTL